MDRRTSLGCLAAPALAPLVPASQGGFIAKGAMVGYADLSDVVIDREQAYVVGIKRQSDMHFEIHFPPHEIHAEIRVPEFTAGPAATQEKHHGEQA